jgi:hypothetical protein
VADRSIAWAGAEKGVSGANDVVDGSSTVNANCGRFWASSDPRASVYGMRRCGSLSRTVFNRELMLADAGIVSGFSSPIKAPAPNRGHKPHSLSGFHQAIGRFRSLRVDVLVGEDSKYLP